MNGTHLIHPDSTGHTRMHPVASVSHKNAVFRREKQYKALARCDFIF